MPQHNHSANVGGTPYGVPPTTGASRYRRLAARRLWLTDAAMIGPALALVLVFVLVPIGIAIYLSMTNWNGFTFPPDWVGIANYRRLIGDQEVHKAAQLTLLIGVVGALLANILGLMVALFLNRNSRVNNLLRSLVFYPYVVGPLILGFLWASLLGTNGAVNALLSSFDQGKLPFLANPTWAVVTLLLVVVWSSFGMHVVLYLAGLQTIDPSLIEAARIDGASEWQTFWRVKLGLLAPTVTLNLILAIIAFLKVYEFVVSLTGGGPAGTTQTTVFHILSTSFGRSQLGYGAAQSVVFLLVIVMITAFVSRLRRRADEGAAA